ncbi:hypothetical protein [Rhizobium ruizarguesonis]|uniref:hypothetical protein n=1 Tax=Rhizobium ruizarguesonis TaxID=2081791 RepID=UPI000480BEF8|nr:hypothetical protein [Rhizobium ruizarguesonis]QJS27155.1 hypothetical protein RLTA1_07525 [Rhizobium leguminosarum bv. trifolii TA1]UFW95896.1 hypothetical protein RlegTA1_07505 [Rhizobium ruizarguesonis]
MSGIKRELERVEDMRRHAEIIAIEAGAIEECEHHDGELLLVDSGDARSKAFAIGTNAFKAGKVDGTREEFMDAIDEAIKNAGVDGCQLCERSLRD